jgi:hypothetical protein
MAKELKGEVIPAEKRFDYAPLEASVAAQVQQSAERIRQSVKRTIEDIIEVGTELLSVKETLPHGKLGAWLKAEFGWTERTAQNFMSVAERFGKSEMISDLRIAPTAAYLLAAPSAPDEAREAAMKLAEEGTPVTAKIAKEILAKERKKPARRRRAGASSELGAKLTKILARYRERWNPKELPALARQLREFADSLEQERGGGRRGKG